MLFRSRERERERERERDDDDDDDDECSASRPGRAIQGQMPLSRMVCLQLSFHRLRDMNKKEKKTRVFRVCLLVFQAKSHKDLF